MATAVVLLWVSLLSLAQAAAATNLAQALALMWVAALGLIALFFCVDLDLLGSAAFAVYTSVFLFLTLFSLYLSSYWASAGSKTRGPGFTLFYFLSLGLAYAAAQTLTPGHPQWASFYALDSDKAFNAAQALHLIFYRLLPLETALANVYLFWGLVVAACFLNVYRSARSASSRTQAFQNTSNLSVRAVCQFRRQTRRKNSTNTRQRL